MPTSPKVMRSFLACLPDDLNGTVIEMGSGWGSLAFALAKALPQCKIQAYENSFFPFLFSKGKNACIRHRNLHFYCSNFFQAPLDQAQLVTCYLYPDAMEKLRRKLEKEVPKNCKVLCHTFAIPHWKPEQVIEVNDLYHTKIYLYSMNTFRSKTLGMA